MAPKKPERSWGPEINGNQLIVFFSRPTSPRSIFKNEGAIKNPEFTYVVSDTPLKKPDRKQVRLTIDQH